MTLMEPITSYIHQNSLHRHALSNRCTYSPQLGGYSDMPPCCHAADTSTPWLSIRCVLRGAIQYETGSGGRHLVVADTYLILNENHPYCVEPLTSERVVEQSLQSFGVFFPRSWARDVYRSLVTSTDLLLAEAPSANFDSIEFFERRFPNDDVVMPHLQQIYALFRRGRFHGQPLEACLYGLLASMLQVQRNAFRDAERLPQIRASTRIELYRRLHLARDYIDATLDQPLTLAEMAQVAALSPYHFARCFKQAFGQTPHAYLTQLRLEKAQTLLTQTAHSITDICLAIGFQSLPSFTNLFRRRFGVSPSQYRQQM